MRWVGLLLWLVPMTATAQGFPALYDVTGVASNDVLNIRAEPNASSDIIGALAHDATGVEAMGDELGWLLVNTGEHSGWASGRFLERTGPEWTDGLPDRLTCYGTEPFWGFTDLDGTGALNLPFEGVEVPFSRVNRGMDAVPYGLSPVLFSAVYFGEELTLATAAIRRERCFDGMSDREMGLSVILTTINGPEIAIFSGCCSLAP